MKFKSAVLCIILLIIFNTNVLSERKSTFNILTDSDSEVLTRLYEFGITSDRAEPFFDAMDICAATLQVQEERASLEQYFLIWLYSDSVLFNEEFSDVLVAFDSVFQDEQQFIIENEFKEVPEIFDEFFMSVMYDYVKPPTEEAPPVYYPPSSEEPPLEEIPPKQEEPVPPPEPEPIFSDLESVPWAEAYIVKLYEEDIVDGYEEKIFRPERQVTRAELAKIVCKAFLNEKFKKDKSEFSDLSKNQWYEEYVRICEYYDIFDMIYKDGFDGDKPATRQEMCTIIYRAALYGNKPLKKENIKEFLDFNTLSPYAIEAVEALSGAGIVNGFEDYCFHPMGQTTRAEVCKVIGLIKEK